MVVIEDAIQCHREQGLAWESKHVPTVKPMYLIYNIPSKNIVFASIPLYILKTGFPLWCLYRHHFFSSDFRWGEIMDAMVAISRSVPRFEALVLLFHFGVSHLTSNVNRCAI
jgi:hypothetical protein